MADKTVIIKIEYNTQQAMTNLAGLNKELEHEKLLRSVIDENYKKNIITQKEYSSQIEQSKLRTKEANDQRKTTIQLLGSEKGSIDQLKAKIAQLTQERNKLNLSTAEGQKQARSYNTQIKSLQSSLKEAQGGQTGLSGAVKGGIANFIAIGAAIGGALVGLKKFGTALINATDSLRDQFDIAMQQAKDSTNYFFKALASGDFTNFFSNLKKISDQAIKYAESMDRLGDLTNELSSKESDWQTERERLLNMSKRVNISEEERLVIIQQIKDGEAKLAKQRIDISQEVFDKEVGHIADLNKIRKEDLVDFVTNYSKYDAQMQRGGELRKKATEVFMQGEAMLFSSGKNKVEKWVSALSDSDKKAMEVEEKFGKVSKEERDKILKVYNSVGAAQREELQNTGRALLTEAKLEKKLTDESVKESTDSAAAKIKAEEKRQKAFDKNHEKGKAAAEETRKDNKQTADEKKKADDEEAKRRGELIWKLAELKEKELENEAKTFEEKRNLQIQFAADEMEHAIAKGDSIEVATAAHNLRLEEIEQEYHANIREQRQRAFDEQYEALQQITDSTAGFADERVTIMSDAFARIATINWKEVKTAQDAYLAIGQAAQGLTALITAGNQAELDDLQSQKDAELKLAGDNMQAKSQIEAKYNKKLAELKRKQFKEEKAMAIVNAAIATSLAIVKALDFAPPMSFIMAGIAGGLGIAQIGMIAAQKQPEITSDTVFAEGGAVIGGRSHAQGGTKFWGEDGSRFEAERGEAMFVLKKDATAEIAALSMLNESHGGRSWNQGASHLADGGEVAPINVEAMVDEAMQRTPIVVKVVDVMTGFTDHDKVKSAGMI